MSTLLRHRYVLIKNTRIKASSRIVDLVTTNKLKHGLPLHRIIQRMVNEDHKRCSTNHVHRKAFPVTSNKFKWVILIQRFAKNSLNVKKEKSYSIFGFFKNGEISL